MTLVKRGKTYWLDVVIHGVRYRESLKTSERGEAKKLALARSSALSEMTPDPLKRREHFGRLSVAEAVAGYASERRSQVGTRMLAYWNENARRLADFYGARKLKDLTSADIAAYQNFRSDAGRAPKTINGEVSVLRQVLKHAKLWNALAEDYRPLPNRKPPIGQALTEEQQEHLFRVAASRPAWMLAYVASVLSFFCGLRACEIRELQWKDIDFEKSLINVCRSKTPAGWRTPSLNAVCAAALLQLHERGSRLGFTSGDHYVFPWHGKDKFIDPTRPLTSWRSAWRALRKAAGLNHVRFHDGRHTALTRLAEAGQPDWVIQAQMGHVSQAMMKTYSHVRRKALNEAAHVLEPTFQCPLSVSEAPKTYPSPSTAQSTAQSASVEREIAQLSKEIGSSGWIRTSNPPVNSRMLCR